MEIKKKIIIMATMIIALGAILQPASVSKAASDSANWSLHHYSNGGDKTCASYHINVYGGGYNVRCSTLTTNCSYQSTSFTSYYYFNDEKKQLPLDKTVVISNKSLISFKTSVIPLSDTIYFQGQLTYANGTQVVMGGQIGVSNVVK